MTTPGTGDAPEPAPVDDANLPSPDDGNGGWELPTPPSFRLTPTVFSHGGYRYAPFHWDPEEETLVRVLRDDDGRARIVEIREEVVERIEVVAGDGGAHPEEIRTTALRIRTPAWEPTEDEMVEVDEAVVFMLELARDVHDFHELCRDEPTLKRIPEIGAGRLLRCPTLWEELAKAICVTQTGWSDAPEAIARVARLGAPVRGLHAWPGPERVLEEGPRGLREKAGLEAGAEHVVDLARRIHRGSLDVEAAESGLLEGPALEELFRSVKGIDDGTAERLLILYGATDRLPGDPSTVAFVRDRHFGGRTPTPDEIEARYERFGRWKGLAYWFEVLQETLWREVGEGF